MLTAGEPTPAAREALSTLYTQYFDPLYACIRRKGHSPTDAEDIAQSFFARLIERNILAGIIREGGRFRTFLLTALDHFLIDEWRKSTAARRVPAQALIHLDAREAESRYLNEPATDLSPEDLYQRRWVHTLMARALTTLQAEFTGNGQGAHFEHLRVYLLGDVGTPPRAEMAARLGVSEGALKVTIHRLRKRHAELFRYEISQTVADPEELRAEVRHLLALFAK